MSFICDGKGEFSAAIAQETLLSMLKTITLLNIFMETVIFFQDSSMNKVKRTAFTWNKNRL